MKGDKLKARLDVIFIVIGLLLLIKWISIFILNYVQGDLTHLSWISNTGLLLAGFGFILRHTFVLSGSFVAIFLFHVFWMMDFISLSMTGSSPFGYELEFQALTWLEFILTTHHFYLSFLLLWAVEKKKEFHSYSWVFASALFLVSSIISFAFGNPDLNVNCAHFPCGFFDVDLLSFLHEMPYLNLLFANVFITIVNYIPLSYALNYVFRKKYRG